MYSEVFLSFSSLFVNFIPFELLTGHRLLFLSLLHDLCGLPLPGRISLNKRISFWSSFAGFEVKVKFSFCCQPFQFLQRQKETSVQFNDFHSYSGGSWQYFITNYLDIEKLQTSVLGHVFKIIREKRHSTTTRLLQV